MERLELEVGIDVLLLETSDALLLQGAVVAGVAGDGGANFHHGRRVRTHSEKLLTGNLDTYERE